MPAEPEHEHLVEERHDLERREEHGVDGDHVERAGTHALARLEEPARERRSRAEALDDADARDGLLDERARVPELLLVELRPGRVPARVAPEADDEQRERRQDQQRQRPVDEEQDDRRADDGHEVADGVAARVEHPAHDLGVARGAAHQLARREAVVEARVEPQRLLEDVVAHVREPARAVSHREDVAARAGDGLDDADRHGHPGPQVDAAPVAVRRRRRSPAPR